MVSVIIPVFNAVNFLERAVKSALNQEYVDEIILIEDGSTDQSLELCRELSKENPQIILFWHPGNLNMGPSSSRNLGWRNAKNKWIQFLDADDELMPGKIASQVETVNHDTAFVVGNAINVFSDGRKSNRYFRKNHWEGLLIGKLGTTPSNLFNKKFLELVNGFNESLRSSEEYFMMFEILKISNNIVFDHKPLTKIHHSKGSISRSAENQRFITSNWIRLRKEIRDYLKKKRQFGLRYMFYYSGAMGSFSKIYGISFDDTISKNLYFIYSFQNNIKLSVYKILYG